MSNGVFANHADQKIGLKMSEEKHELSEVPLMSDTDKDKTDPSKEDTEHQLEEKKDTGTEKKKAVGFQGFGLFKKGSKTGGEKEKEKMKTEGPETEGEKKEGATEATATVEAAAVPKKEKFNAKKWFASKTQKPQAAEGTDGETAEPKREDSITFGLNLQDRDEHHVNDHVKLQFEDIFAEPEGYHSWDCAWRATFRTFRGVRNIVYKLLALIFAIPCAIVWGILFGLLTCLNVWACVPSARFLLIIGTWIAKVWNFIVKSLFDPLFRSCGLCFSSISMRRETKVQAVPVYAQDPVQIA